MGSGNVPVPPKRGRLKTIIRNTKYIIWALSFLFPKSGVVWPSSDKAWGALRKDWSDVMCPSHNPVTPWSARALNLHLNWSNLRQHGGRRSSNTSYVEPVLCRAQLLLISLSRWIIFWVIFMAFWPPKAPPSWVIIIIFMVYCPLVSCPTRWSLYWPLAPINRETGYSNVLIVHLLQKQRIGEKEEKWPDAGASSGKQCGAW